MFDYSFDIESAVAVGISMEFFSILFLFEKNNQALSVSLYFYISLHKLLNRKVIAATKDTQ
jgi:hypothetical protein